MGFSPVDDSEIVSAPTQVPPSGFTPISDDQIMPADPDAFSTQPGTQDYSHILTGGLGNILNSATFNLADKGISALAAFPASLMSQFTDNPMGPVDAYDKILPDLSGDINTFKKENPVAGLIGTVGGGAQTPIPFANKIFSSTKGVLPTVGNIAKASGLGGALSGVYGFNEGAGDLSPEGIDQRVQTARDSIIPGLVTGGILGTGIETATGASNKLGDLGDSYLGKVLGFDKLKTDGKSVYLDANGKRVYNATDAGPDGQRIPETTYLAGKIMDSGLMDNVPNLDKVSLRFEQANENWGQKVGDLSQEAHDAWAEQNGTGELPKEFQPNFKPMQDYVDTVKAKDSATGDKLQDTLDTLKAKWENGDKTFQDLKTEQEAAGATKSAFKDSIDPTVNQVFGKLRYGTFADPLSGAFDAVMPEARTGELSHANDMYRGTEILDKGMLKAQNFGLKNAWAKNMTLRQMISQSGAVGLAAHLFGHLTGLEGVAAALKGGQIAADINPLLTGRLLKGVAKIPGFFSPGRGGLGSLGANRSFFGAGESGGEIPPTGPSQGGIDATSQLGLPPGDMKALPWDMEAGQGFSMGEPSPARGLPAGQGFTNRDINMGDLLSGQKVLPPGEAAPLGLPQGQGFTVRDPIPSDYSTIQGLEDAKRATYAKQWEEASQPPRPPEQSSGAVTQLLKRMGLPRSSIADETGKIRPAAALTGALGAGVIGGTILANQAPPSQKDLIGNAMDNVEAKAKVVNSMTTKMQPTESDPIIKAVVKQESGGRANAVGPQTKYGTAKGAMQLLDSTGKEWHAKLGIEQPYDPFNKAQNIEIGTAYLNSLKDKYNGDLQLALAAFNWGMGNVDRALKDNSVKTFDGIKDDLPDETQTYVKNIFAGTLKNLKG